MRRLPAPAGDDAPDRARLGRRTDAGLDRANGATSHGARRAEGRPAVRRRCGPQGLRGRSGDRRGPMVQPALGSGGGRRPGLRRHDLRRQLAARGPGVRARSVHRPADLAGQDRAGRGPARVGRRHAARAGAAKPAARPQSGGRLISLATAHGDGQDRPATWAGAPSSWRRWIPCTG